MQPRPFGWCTPRSQRGINFFDTSPYYGRTLSESRLGEALQGRRDQVILASKGGRFDAELETGFRFQL